MPGAFQDCTSLLFADLSQTSLERIYENAFNGASSMSSVLFKEGVKQIAKNAFANTALSEAYLPMSVTTLDKNAFDTDTVIHFTGNILSTYHLYVDANFDRHYYPILQELLNRGVSIGQFFGHGLDGQKDYFISTSGTGYGTGSEDGGTSLAPSAEGGADAEAGQTDADTAVSSQSNAGEEQQGEEQLPSEGSPDKVYELVQKTIAENPVAAALTLAVVLIVIIMGGYFRVRKNRKINM